MKYNQKWVKYLVSLFVVFSIMIVGISTASASNKILKNNKLVDSEFTFNGTVVTGYTGTNKDISIPSSYVDDEGITHKVNTIGDRAFYKKDITSVKMPEGIYRINYQAFAFTNLTEISFPTTLNSFSELSYAFMGDPISKITIPDKVISAIGPNWDWVFYMLIAPDWHTDNWLNLDYDPDITINGKALKILGGGIGINNDIIFNSDNSVSGIVAMDNYRNLNLGLGTTINNVMVSGSWLLSQTNPYIEVNYVDNSTGNTLVDKTQLTGKVGTKIPTSEVQAKINILLSKGYTLANGDSNPIPNQTGDTFIDGKGTAQSYTLHFIKQ